MPHALVIGGTGMLRYACLGLARRGYSLALVARDQAKLEELAGECHAQGRGGAPRIFVADHRSGPALDKAIRDALPGSAGFDLALCWMGSMLRGPLDLVAQRIGDKAHPPVFYHLVGSVAEDPSTPAFSREDLAAHGLIYRRIIMGYIVEDGRARWLSDDETCMGVLDAIDREQGEFVIGSVSPWDKHP